MVWLEFGLVRYITFYPCTIESASARGREKVRALREVSEAVEEEPGFGTEVLAASFHTADLSSLLYILVSIFKVSQSTPKEIKKAIQEYEPPKKFYGPLTNKHSKEQQSNISYYRQHAQILLQQAHSTVWSSPPVGAAEKRYKRSCLWHLSQHRAYCQPQHLLLLLGNWRL